MEGLVKRPGELLLQQKLSIPKEVLEAFEAEITKQWDGTQARVLQKDVIARIKNISKEELYANHWLDVEPIFRANGWDVKYDKPAYCENYNAFFIFGPEKK